MPERSTVSSIFNPTKTSRLSLLTVVRINGHIRATFAEGLSSTTLLRAPGWPMMDTATTNLSQCCGTKIQSALQHLNLRSVPYSKHSHFCPWCLICLLCHIFSAPARIDGLNQLKTNNLRFPPKKRKEMIFF